MNDVAVLLLDFEGFGPLCLHVHLGSHEGLEGLWSKYLSRSESNRITAPLLSVHLSATDAALPQWSLLSRFRRLSRLQDGLPCWWE
ncbi:hypothetical protein AOLI_G00210230 [Acnodon oligacanthus]